MPGFDGTGPQGLGPKTGRGMGYCLQEPLPVSTYGAGRAFMGMRGFGRGRGMRGGRGRNRRFY